MKKIFLRHSSSGVPTILFLYTLLSFGSFCDSATIVAQFDQKHQMIEGFGGGLSFRIYPYFHPMKDELYDSIFNVARINIIRINNYYNLPPYENEVVEVPMMQEIQERWPETKTILTSWTPPPFLKSNDALVGGNELNEIGTLKKNSDSSYMYDEYGYNWMKSVQYFTNNFITIDWVSIQNEPDCAAWYEGCVFQPRETPVAASYGKALNAVYTMFHRYLLFPPPLIGPDNVGLGDDLYAQYLKSPELDRNQLSAYSHHYYHFSGPEQLTKPPELFPDKPIYQTEFLINEGENGRTWFDHAILIHNALTIEEVSMYCIFALAYKPASTHCLFSLDTLGSNWYKPQPTYYMFKHFSRSIRRGWRRCDISVDDTNLLVSAYSNSNNDSATVIIINVNDQPLTVNIAIPGMYGYCYQTTDSCKYINKGVVENNTAITCDQRSITTIDLHNTSNGTKLYSSKNRQTKAKIEKLEKVTSGIIRVHCSLPEFASGTLLLLDMRGNVLDEKKVSSGILTGSRRYLLKNKIANGSYIVQLKCGRFFDMKKIYYY